MVSRKHFKELADKLKGTKPTDPSLQYQWERDVLAVAEALIGFNPRFNLDRFLDACGYEKKAAA